MVLEYVGSENEENPTEDPAKEFTVNNLLGYMLKRANYQSNPSVAVIGKLLESSQPVEQGNMIFLKTIAHKYKNNVCTKLA